MSLETGVKELAEAVGTDVKSLNLKIGDISKLQTAAKSNLVAAINEAATSGGGGSGGGAIDGALRSDLANPDKGAAMVARGVVAVDSIADLLSLPEEYRRDDLRYLVKSYHPPQDYLAQPYSGGGLFSYDPERSLENDGGMILNGFVRNITDRHPTIGPEFFGARYDLSETLVPVDYMSDRPEQSVRITTQTTEAECVNKCIRWARSRPDLLVNVKISGFIKVYAYLEPLDFDIKISGSSPQTSGFQCMDTSPTNAPSYGIIVCGKPRNTGSNFVWIENIKLDGRGSFRLKPDKEHRVYNLATYTGNNLYAHNIESVDSPIDCLNIGGETAYVVKSIFKGCYRNTVTAGSVGKWAKFIDCEISEAGYVHGGTNPRYGVDVEPNVATKPAELVEFVRCKISKAVGSLVGAVWSTTVWDDCEFDGSERTLEAQTASSPWLGIWSQGNHMITGCRFIGNSDRGNTVHGGSSNHVNSDFGYDSRLVFKDNLFKGCGLRVFGFNTEVIGNRIENSARGITASRPNSIDTQRFVIKDNYLYNVIPIANGEIAAIQIQAAIVGEVLVEGNTVVFDRNELEWVDGVILEQLKHIQAFQVTKPSSGTASGTRIILNNTAINYYKEYIEGLIPLTETGTVKGWVGSIADSPAESWPPMPNDPAFYRGNL